MVTFRGGHQMARGWRYTKASLASVPLCVIICERVYTMHALYSWDPCASLRPTHPFFVVFVYVCCFALVGAL